MTQPEFRVASIKDMACDCDACSGKRDLAATDDYAAPEPWSVRPTTTTEAQYKAARLRELAAEYKEHDAAFLARPTPRLTTAELDAYTPPNPWTTKEKQ